MRLSSASIKKITLVNAGGTTSLSYDKDVSSNLVTRTFEKNEL
jgi:hypothetical protein